jgi:secreted trypsin-like serine protease
MQTLAAMVMLFLSLTLLASLATAQENQPNPQKDGGPISEAPTIVGGQQASPGEWPWQVALVSWGADPYYGQYCGGSLIDVSWVLTAAHCVDGSSPSNIQILAGIHNLGSPEAGYQRINVDQIFVHPSYNASTSNNDVALLKLSTPAVLGTTPGGEQVATIPLVSASVGTLAGVTATITGWGSTGSSYPTELREATCRL